MGNEHFDTHGLFLLLVAKHRNGELGEIPLRFIHEQTKLTNYSNSNFDPIEPNKNFDEKISTFVQEEVKDDIPKDLWNKDDSTDDLTDLFPPF